MTAPPPHVLVVEPYLTSGGHFDQAAHRARQAFAAAGVDTTLVELRHDAISRVVGVFARALSFSMGTLIRLRRRVHPAADPGKDDSRTAAARALHVELPHLVAARRLSRSLRGRGERVACLVCSSYVRPLWIKPLVLGPDTPVVEQIFERTSLERSALLGRRVRIAATTPAIARGVQASVKGAAVGVVAHFPLSARRDVAESEVGADLRDVVTRMRDRDLRFGLHFGFMHGKKELDTIMRGALHLPAGTAVLLVGDPAWEGENLPAQIRELLDRSTTLFSVLRRTTDDERDWLFGRCDFSIVSQKTGYESMSGSVLDALSYEVPLIGTRTTPAGDLIKDLAVGAVHDAGDARDFGRAVAELAASKYRLSPKYDRYGANGLFEPNKWATTITDLADR